MAARLWNKAPFIRLLIALCAGCLFQWYLQFSLTLLTAAIATSLFFVSIYSFTFTRQRYRFRTLNGMMTILLFSSIGGFLIWTNDTRHDQNWIGHQRVANSSFVVILEEPLVEKANSYKALASFISINHGDSAK